MKKLSFVLCLLVLAQLGFSEYGETLSKQTRPASRYRTSSPANFADRIPEMSKAELAGKMNIDEFLLNREEYVGKIVRLQFYRGDFHLIGSVAYITMYSEQHDFQTGAYLPDIKEAKEWAIAVDKKNVSGFTLYIYIDENRQYALGSRRRKTDEGYIYLW